MQNGPLFFFAPDRATVIEEIARDDRQLCILDQAVQNTYNAYISE